MTKDGVKKKRRDSGKTRTAWEIWGWVLIGVGAIVIGYGIWYMKCAADPDWLGSLWKEDKDIVSTGRGIAAAGMGIVGMGLVVIRISKQEEQLDKQEEQLKRQDKQLDKQDEQLKKQDKQLAEQQTNTYLTKLHYGMDQIFSGDSLKQYAGVLQLHSLAEAEEKAGHKDHVKTILRAYCLLLKDSTYSIPKGTKGDNIVKAIKKYTKGNQSYRLKNLTLGYITKRDGIYVSSDIELMYADLRGANLQSAYLQYADLQYADLQCAHLEGADLLYAHLEGAHLQYAHLEGAHLQQAHLECTHLEGTHLEEASLPYAYLACAYLRDAHLQSAHLLGAYLHYADLAGADLAGAQLLGTDLRYAHLEGTHLEGADLQGAIISSKYKAYIAKQGVKEEKLIIWVKEDHTFEWQEEKLTRDTLIEKLRASDFTASSTIDAIIKNLEQHRSAPFWAHAFGKPVSSY